MICFGTETLKRWNAFF